MVFSGIWVVTEFLAYLQFELQPVNNVIPDAKVHIQEQALTCDIEDLENRFDDLRNTKALVEYLEDEDEGEEDEDVEEFCSKVNERFSWWGYNLSLFNVFSFTATSCHNQGENHRQNYRGHKYGLTKSIQGVVLRAVKGDRREVR